MTLPEHHVATRFTVADGEGESTLNWEVLTGGRLGSKRCADRGGTSASRSAIG